jgi:hypothetical protein
VIRTAAVIRRRALLLLLFALGGCASYRLIRAGEVNVGVAERVKAKLVALRGLRFQAPVPIQAVSPAEARSILEREIHHQFEPGELAKIGRVYSALGLFSPNTDLEHAFLDLYGQQVAGFYEPIERRMVLVADAIAVDLLTRIVQGVLRRDLTGELVLAHELTHALQDQHFGLDVSRSNLGEDDAQLARHAVYEGDATLAGFGTVIGALQPKTAIALAGKLERIPGQLAHAYPDIPAVIRDTVVFQYVAGVNFVSWAYQRAGWDGVNALLSRPPVSTEQILHPEKYFVRAEYPLTVHVGASAPYIQAGWELAEESTLGELTIQLLAERFFDRQRAAAVAAGWDGDRLVALTRGSNLALEWLTAWDSEGDAGEFFTAYAEILGTKHRGGSPTDKGDTIVARTGDAPYYLERRGTKVLAVEGPLDADLPGAAERIWRRSTYEPNMPWLPIDLAAEGQPPPAPGRSSPSE